VQCNLSLSSERKEELLFSYFYHIKHLIQLFWWKKVAEMHPIYHIKHLIQLFWWKKVAEMQQKRGRSLVVECLSDVVG
jgi:hypothetical protein